MAAIESSVTVDAPLERVWAIVSDLDSEPEYWKGTKSVRNISREGNLVRREVVIAFRDKKCEQEARIVPNESVTFTFTSGVILGTKTVKVRSEGARTVLDVVWEIRLSGALGMFTGMLKKHIRGGTEQALQSIKNAAEGSSP